MFMNILNIKKTLENLSFKKFHIEFNLLFSEVYFYPVATTLTLQ